ncbi:MAG: hypothetical protein ABSC53_08580 [Bacteroidota bacterium]
MNIIITTALIGVGGTALGVFIASWFNLLAKKAEHNVFIRRFRFERSFAFCEQLISHIYSAEYTGLIDYNGKKVQVYHLLQQKEKFLNWYTNFVDTWRSKQYLLDKRSLVACQKLTRFLFALTDSHEQLIRESSLKPLTQEELAKVTEELRPLLFEVHESLQAFLQCGIENV